MQHNRKRAHIARCNLKQAFPQWQEEQRAALLEQVAKETGKWFFESLYVWFRPFHYWQNKITIKNAELLERAYRQDKGVVIILPHLGNWELLNFYVPQHYPFGAMYKPVKSSVFERMILKARSKTGAKLFATNSKGVRQALKSLKQGHIVAVLPDHLPSKQAGVYAPFFRRPALTGKLTHTLIQHNHSQVVLASITRTQEKAKFCLSFEALDIQSDSAVNTACTINQAIETCILRHLEQYQWVYRRFAHPPPGEVDIYKGK